MPVSKHLHRTMKPQLQQIKMTFRGALSPFAPAWVIAQRIVGFME